MKTIKTWIVGFYSVISTMQNQSSLTGQRQPYASMLQPKPGNQNATGQSGIGQSGIGQSGIGQIGIGQSGIGQSGINQGSPLSLDPFLDQMNQQQPPKRQEVSVNMMQKQPECLPSQGMFTAFVILYVFL